MDAFTILGTDTDAGKTTFALLFLAAFPDRWRYWKPVETGQSDSETIGRLVHGSIVHKPVAHFREPVAPPLAARREGKSIPSAAQLAGLTPECPYLVIETFGSPFSPLNETELQIEFIRRLHGRSLLVASSKLGAIGRTLSHLEALRVHGVDPAAAILIGGREDDYARDQIEKHGKVPVFALQPPQEWDVEGVRLAARSQRDVLLALNDLFCTAFPAAKPAGRNEADPLRSVESLLALDQQCVWHPYTPLRGADSPLAVVSAQDEFLYLADGRRVIDGISSWWTILNGHRPPRLMRALEMAMQSFDHVLFAGVTHPPAVRVAQLLLETAPWQNGRVFFSDNGSTAVEVALKMAYQFWCHAGQPRRTLFVGFEHGYHGDTFGAMAVGRDPLFFGRFEPLLFRAERLPVCAGRLDDFLAKNADQTAAVIIEPLVQAAGGMRMHSPDELRAIHDVARRHGVLFIADEVMTGCYRTGAMWAFESAKVAPDLVCTAKTLAGGVLPLAATLVSPRIVESFDTADRLRTFFHGHSFTAHPLACAVAAENLDWLRTTPPDAPARFEAFWKSALAPLRGSPRVVDIRIRGTIAAIEVDLPGGYLAEAAREMRRCSLEYGVFLRPLGNVLYAMPPFATSDQSLRQIADAMKSALAALPR